MRDNGRAASVLAVVLFVGAIPAPLVAQVSEPAAIQALRIDEDIDIDGRLDEPAWSRAEPISNFTQRELNYGEPVSERTAIALVYDADALYIGFWGYDREPQRILATQMARDFSSSSDDNFEIVLDTFDDDRTGYLFITNPNGALADALIADNGAQINRDWDGVWEVRARITDEGWFAELRIPFSTLSSGPRPQDGWGVNFERNIRRKREQVMWQGWSRDYNLERISQGGTILGLHDLSGTRLIDVRPQGLAGFEWLDEAERDTVGHLGIDVRYNPTAAWRLNATVNPDFAQVEADRETVNLTRFPLFFPEKREFFLEGQEFFDFELASDTQPFYSRRIGLAADRTEIPILLGGRVLGKQGGTTIGGMVLQTAAKQDDLGIEREPTANFGVFRIKQDVLEESSVGALLVSRIEPGRYNFTYGVDLAYTTSEMLGDKEFTAGLVLAQSYTSDADAKTGLAHRLYAAYPNDLLEMSASWVKAADSFDPEVGFVRRRGYQRWGSEVVIAPRPAFLPLIQQMEFKPWEVSYYQNDATGELESFAWEVVPLAFTTRSGEQFEIALHRRGERLYEPFELFEGVEIPPGEYWYWRWGVEFDTFTARRLSGSVEVGGGDFYSGEQRSVALSGRWRMSKHLTLQGDWEHNLISLDTDEFSVQEAALRADYAFTPSLFGSVATQWNNEDDEAIVNFRLDWIPEPGSVLYFVINQNAATRFPEAPELRWHPTRTTVLTKMVWRFAF